MQADDSESHSTTPTQWMPETGGAPAEGHPADNGSRNSLASRLSPESIDGDQNFTSPELPASRSRSDASNGTRSRSNLTSSPASRAELGLTGNVISATFCLPYNVSYAAGGEWKLARRRGTTALFASLSYLASSGSTWNHTLVGWTGEIDHSPSNGTGPRTFEDRRVKFASINAASAPFPVNTHAKPQQSDETEDLHVPLEHRQRLETQLKQQFGGRVTTVWLPDATHENETYTFRQQEKWRRFGEDEIFPLFHYKQNQPSDGRATREAWDKYKEMNMAFADAVIKLYKPGDLVIVHDYHLLLLPSLLRQRLPDMHIGSFLHIPFPSSEFFRCLPHRKEILHGMLGANMIAFQNPSYTQHFAVCCKLILGLERSKTGIDLHGRHVAFDAFPTGINAESTVRSAFGSSTEAMVAALHKESQYEGKKIIVSRDRLDSTRGIAQKLQAYEIFLERHSEWHEKVLFIQITGPPSMEDRGENVDGIESRVSELAAQINDHFGSPSHTPVHYYSQYLSQDEYFALLRLADLCLITSVREATTTTALEYILCQRETHCPLIISEFSGTADQLEKAIIINPWDLNGVASAIDHALRMSEADKQESHRVLYERVTANSVQAWTNKYLDHFLAYLLQSRKDFNFLPPLDPRELLKHHRNSTRRLFMFDYDGTLTPIVRDPESAVPTDRVIRTLKALASDPGNNVWIISGRSQRFLEEWMGHISALGLSAEHGSFVRMPNSTRWENLTATFDLGWQSHVSKLFEAYKESTPGSAFEPKQIALTWHYRSADPDFGLLQAKKLELELQELVSKKYEVEVMSGKANIEVRPRSVNKGEIAKRLVEGNGQGDDQIPDFVLCLGDDKTDEDMFLSLRASNLNPENVFAVAVGVNNRSSLARWSLPEPEDVISTIALLNDN